MALLKISGGVTFSGKLVWSAIPDQTFTLGQSLIFNDNDLASLAWTPSSDGNKKTWTWSGWIKRGETPAVVYGSGGFAFFTAGRASSPWFTAQFGKTATNNGFNAIQISFTAGVVGGSYTTAVFRDSAEWYHVVIAVDTTQATASDRLKLYVNGVLQSFGTTNYPTLNSDTQVNDSTKEMTVGGYSGSYFDGYMAEVHFVDGTAHNATDFGEFDSDGVWVPKQITGLTYGSNGSYLDFADSGDLGNDVSGNSNDWTPNNFASSDQSSDTPTNNLSTFNAAEQFAQYFLSEGNKVVTTNTGSAWATAIGTMGLDSGKWYFEMKLVAGTGVNSIHGLVGPKSYVTNTFVGAFEDGWGLQPNFSGTTARWFNSAGALTLTGFGTLSVNGIIMVAYDADNGDLWWGLNGTWYNSGDPANGTNPTVTGLPSGLSPAASSFSTTTSVRFLTTSSELGYTVPTGFSTVEPSNLTASITDGSEYFDVATYTGTGATQNITGLSFSPDIVWIKRRSLSATHKIYDTTRGATNALSPDVDTAESVNLDGLTAFLSDGFTIGTAAGHNSSGDTFVSWNWKEGTVPGVDVVTYSGTGVAGLTVSHNLGAVPAMMIVKNRTNIFDWIVYHKALDDTAPEDFALILNETNARIDTDTGWNDTAPTSSQFTLGNSASVNQSGSNHVAYLFAEIEGFSKFGTYVGNASNDGPFIYCGFRPAFLVMKRVDSTNNWYMYDSARSAINEVDNQLLGNLTTAETTGSEEIDFLSNGFKHRSGDAAVNQNTGEYIYYAFAENPFKKTRAR